MIIQLIDEARIREEIMAFIIADPPCRRKEDEKIQVFKLECAEIRAIRKEPKVTPFITKLIYVQRKKKSEYIVFDGIDEKSAAHMIYGNCKVNKGRTRMQTDLDEKSVQEL